MSSSRSTTNPKDDLISILAAARAGYPRLRLDKWTPGDYIELHITEDGRPGPWVDYWSSANLVINGFNPVRLMILTLPGTTSDPIWRPYGGPHGTPAPILTY